MTAAPPYADIAACVVADFRKRNRELPWRRNKDAYAVWISEIMLQQTRIAAVIPYFERWLARFPTVEALAESELEDVLAHWSGLGYYSRARNIHSCAGELQAEYGGKLPKSARELRALPGIGRYTAGAISSIAYGQREALVDGNVARILSRLFAIEESIKSTAVIKRLWALCEELVPADAPGDFNQGLMELGSLICTPKNPKCKQCPVAGFCQALAQGKTSELPLVPKRLKASDKPLLETHAAYLLRRGKLLLAQRTPKGLYGGLWELPQSSDRAQLEALTGLQLSFSGGEPSVVHEQVLSHRRLKIQVWPASPRGRTRLAADSSYQDLAWHSPPELGKLGISAATKSILERRIEIEYGPKTKNRA